MSFRRKRLCRFLSLMINMMFYIHIPFCLKKCLYCDFFSQTDTTLSELYADEVINEAKQYKGLKADSIYIGGGTPSSVPKVLVKIMAALGDILEIHDCEYTVEINPGTTDYELFKTLKQMGANRLSIGAQSFSDNELKALGRIHSSDMIYEAVDKAKKAGFKNISADIMLAVPGQTKESLMHTLDCIEGLELKHISAYSLIIEENTPFAEMELDLPDEDTEREMYYLVCKRLENMGMKQYEISNFAYPGFESRHNTGYWTGTEYIGIGAGAHSYYKDMRYSNEPDIKKYISGGGRAYEPTLISPEEKELERFMLGLRMTKGILYNGEFPERVEPLIKNGLLEISGSRLRLTKRGIDLANLVFMEFLYE